MIYKLVYSDGSIKEMEREELKDGFNIPSNWKLGMIKSYLKQYYSIKVTEEYSREQKIYARLAKVKRPKPVGFKVGDRIKLKGYSEYEYPDYINQEAVIINKASGSEFDWRIRWANDDTSCVSKDNIILVRT